jgi:hypothetical protein
LISLTLGQTNKFEAEFSDSRGSQLNLSTVNYYLISQNGIVILTGACVQNVNNPKIWEITLTIPTNAPINSSAETKYKLKFSAVDNKGNIHTNTQEFFIVDLTVEDQYSREILVMEGASKFSDYLVLPTTITKYQITILDISNNEIWSGSEVTNPTPFRTNTGKNVYKNSWTSKIDNMEAGETHVAPYYANWTYTRQDGVEESELHPIYVANMKVVNIINSIKRFINKSEYLDINPDLQFSDADILHFTIQGLNRINTAQPQLTEWHMGNFPYQMNYLLEKAATHELLNSWYLAEGMNTFNFSGQSAQLDVDRTQFIQTKMDEINNYLDQNLRIAKKNYLKTSAAGRGSIGVISVNFGPNLRFPVASHRAYAWFRQQAWR